MEGFGFFTQFPRREPEIQDVPHWKNFGLNYNRFFGFYGINNFLFWVLISMHCIVVTPDKTVVDLEANFVAIPLYDGEYGVLTGHSPMVGRLGAGELRLKTPNGTTEHYFVAGGFVEVLDDDISLLTTRAYPVSEIDPVEVQQELDSILAKPATTAEHAYLREKSMAACRAQLRLAKK